MPKPAKLSLDCEGAEIIMNPGRVDLGHLAGRNERSYAYSNWGQQWSAVSKKTEWLVRAAGPDARITVTAVSEKGGTVRRATALGGDALTGNKKGSSTT